MIPGLGWWGRCIWRSVVCQSRWEGELVWDRYAAGHWVHWSDHPGQGFWHEVRDLYHLSCFFFNYMHWDINVTPINPIMCVNQRTFLQNQPKLVKSEIINIRGNNFDLSNQMFAMIAPWGILQVDSSSQARKYYAAKFKPQWHSRSETFQWYLWWWHFFLCNSNDFVTSYYVAFSNDSREWTILDDGYAEWVRNLVCWHIKATNSFIQYTVLFHLSIAGCCIQVNHIKNITFNIASICDWTDRCFNL